MPLPPSPEPQKVPGTPEKVEEKLPVEMDALAAHQNRPFIPQSRNLVPAMGEVENDSIEPLAAVVVRSDVSPSSVYLLKDLSSFVASTLWRI